MAGAFPCCCKKKGSSTSTSTSSRVKCCTEYVAIALTFEYNADSVACSDTISNWIVPISQTIQLTPTLSICRGVTPKTDWCDIILGPLQQYRRRWWIEAAVSYGTSIPAGYVRLTWQLREDHIDLVFGTTATRCIAGSRDYLNNACYPAGNDPGYIDCLGTCDSFAGSRDRATELADWAGPRVLTAPGISCTGWSYMRLLQSDFSSA